MDPEAYAKRLLVHYLTLNNPQLRNDGDCLAEIESIVELIISAAIEQMRGEELNQ